MNRNSRVAITIAAAALAAWQMREMENNSGGGTTPPPDHSISEERVTGSPGRGAIAIVTPSIEEKVAVGDFGLRTGSADHVEQLINRAIDAGDPYARSAILEALRTMQPMDEQALEVAASVHLVSADPEICEAAVAFVARFATPATVATLRAFAAEAASDSAARDGIVATIRAIDSPAALEALQTTLGDPLPEVREAAAAALGRSGTDAAIARLVELGGDEAALLEVREAALAALQDLPRSVAETWLARLADEPASDLLVNVLRRAATRGEEEPD